MTRKKSLKKTAVVVRNRATTARVLSVRNPPQARQVQRSKPVNYSNQSAVRGGSMIKFRGSNSDGSGLIVEGCEFFKDLIASNVYSALVFAINPSNILMFPKLQSMGQLFEEFYVKSLYVEYVPACPTTRSGSITLAFDYDALDPSPKSVLEAMANTSSVTVGVGERAVCTFTPGAQRNRWYFTNIPTNVTGDLRQIAPSKLHVLLGNATSGDTGLIAGYLKVHYQMEFRTMRPPPESFALATSVTSPVTVGSGSQKLPLLLENAMGFSGWTDSSLTRGIPGAYANILTGKNSLLLSAGAWVLDALWSWLGTASGKEEKSPLMTNFISEKEVKTPHDMKLNSLERPKLARTRRPPQGLIRRVTQDVDEKEEGFCIPSPRRTGNDVSYVSVWQDPSDGQMYGMLAGGEWVLIPPTPPPSIPLTPFAANDYALYMTVVDLITGLSTDVDTTTGNNASAFSYSKVLTFSNSNPVALLIQTNNAEARGLDVLQLGATRSESLE